MEGGNWAEEGTWRGMGGSRLSMGWDRRYGQMTLRMNGNMQLKVMGHLQERDL